ncbi:helix-turn-helix transcriptional regulator [Desulfatibacillum aliphaticivorans]|uniref:helix-turn-helix transcriptional regulator n=1 Tax=Desulfatibacillum aliphaticivorans TaxID=218208 RepID=UPI000416C7A3|nr:helix-turn-helix transcriptional regulator [Desulfatibacillum aliphaticivorans]
MADVFLSTKQVAEFLDVNEKMVYTLISEKGLPATKITGKWKFPQRLVEKWLEKHIINNPSPRADVTASGLLVFAGSNDLLLERTFALFNRSHKDYLAVFANVGSMGGINALNKGFCHVAASHLMQEDGSEYNFQFVPEKFGGDPPAVINFAMREQGIVVAKGNPMGMEGIKDLGKSGVRIVNRPLGTGTRLLFDSELKNAGIKPEKLKGYNHECRSHLEVALEIAAGNADAGLAIRPASNLLGLDFIPLRWERFDLLVGRDRFFDKGVQSFLGLLQEPEFRKIAEKLGGYSLDICGKIVYPQPVRRSKE